MTLTELRELAERATPGPWGHYHAPSLRRGMGGSPVNEVQAPRGVVVKWTGFDAADGSHPQRRADARYIAACSPEVIKALVAVAEIAERVDDARSPAVGLLNDLSAALDALKAALA